MELDKYRASTKEKYAQRLNQLKVHYGILAQNELQTTKEELRQSLLEKVRLERQNISAVTLENIHKLKNDNQSHVEARKAEIQKEIQERYVLQ